MYLQVLFVVVLRVRVRICVQACIVVGEWAFSLLFKWYLVFA